MDRYLSVMVFKYWVWSGERKGNEVKEREDVRFYFFFCDSML